MPNHYVRRACTAIAFAALTILCTLQARSMDLRPTMTLQIKGLVQRVEILHDKWGVAHIYASNFDDVFFAQGFNAVRDRLWQMDMWRKRGLGEMAKDFGAAYVDGDRMARAFLFRGDSIASGSPTAPTPSAWPKRLWPVSTRLSPSRSASRRGWPKNFASWATSQPGGAPRTSCAYAIMA